jgi:hypothetical protein
MTSNTELITVRINTEFANILREQAKKNNLKPTSYLRLILETHAKNNSTLNVSPEQAKNAVQQLSLLFFLLTEDYMTNKHDLFAKACIKHEKSSLEP